MEEDVYRTIENISEGLYKEKGSKFLAFAYPVVSEEEVKIILDELRTRYYDARHHCYAYRLGAGNPRIRANDDGEPSSTAGKPILGQIVSAELTDILVVVVRYFGGIKLGVSGLINAYRTAAADALAHAKPVEKTVREELRFHFGYAVLNDVMKVIKEEDPEVLQRDFGCSCSLTVSVRKKQAPVLKTRLSRIESLTWEE